MPPVEQTLDKWIATMTGVGVPSDFDVVIMNPPFTRRERIPDEISKLEKLVPEVAGKTGYWAYFVIPANNVLKQNGVLAVVMPEEFFVGKSAESVRKHLFQKGYEIQHIVRSAVEVAFSESALYRDYLIVFRKGEQLNPLSVTILKKKLQDIRGKVGDISLKIKEFESSPESRLSFEEFESLKIYNADGLLKKHIGNLKPLVGFNTVKAHMLALQLLDDLKDKPTLNDLERLGIIKIKVYNPGQYKSKGNEKYARKLFASKYGTRSPNVVFLIHKLTDGNVSLRLRKAKMSVSLPLSATVPSLRTYSQVKHMDVTGDEELAVIDPKSLPSDILKLADLLPTDRVVEAAKDIKFAYDDLASNILLVRKNQLSSPELYWMAFCSDKKVIGTTSGLLNMHTNDDALKKYLVIYFNSVVALLQLIAFVAETRGAWVTLHGKQVWSHIHVPDIKNLGSEKLAKAQNLFASISKHDVKSLYQRVRQHDKIQRLIDEIALEMVGLDSWRNRLDELYDALASELETMHKILETSKRAAVPRRK